MDNCQHQNQFYLQFGVAERVQSWVRPRDLLLCLDGLIGFAMMRMTPRMVVTGLFLSGAFRVPAAVMVAMFAMVML